MCNCMFCGHEAKSQNINQFTIYNCSVCGCYTVNNEEISERFMPYFNLPEEQKIRSEFVTKYSSFLFYHKKTFNDYCNKNRFFIGNKESALLLNSINGENIEYQVLTDDIVSNFYPITIKKTKELILTKIYNDRENTNNTSVYTEPEAESLFFINREFINPKLIASCTDAYNQINEILDKLKNDGLLEYSEKILPSAKKIISLKLTIKSREFVEELNSKNTQPNSPNIYNYGVFVNDSQINNSEINNSHEYLLDSNRKDYTLQQKHDIECLARILESIPKNFNEQLEIRLLANRQYKQSELDYIFDLDDIINDNDNFLVDEELRKKVEQLRDESVKLSNLINRQFCRDRNNTDLIVLDRPLPGETDYRRIYEQYLQVELPQALVALKEAYDDLCHARTIRFGI